MILLQLNDRNSYCHDLVYVFFPVELTPELRNQFLQEINHHFDRRAPKTVGSAVHIFKELKTVLPVHFPGIVLIDNTPAARDFAAFKGKNLSKAELAHVLEDRTGDWAAWLYGLAPFTSEPKDHPVWLVHDWFINLSSVARPESFGFVQANDSKIVELSLRVVRDENGGGLWEARWEEFARSDPRHPGYGTELLFAEPDSADLMQILVEHHQLLQDKLKEFYKENLQ